MNLPLFDQAHRSGDPHTSALADRAATESGRRRNDCQRIMAHLVETSILSEDRAATNGEISSDMGWDYHRVVRRRVDMLRKGPWRVGDRLWMLREGPARTCRVQGSRCITSYVQETTEVTP